jgi:ubiquitin carboxyl-terminal hydrolase 8
LDGLHEDLNPNANKTKLKPLTENQELQRERLPIQVASIIEWQRYTHLNSSVTVNWLQGQLSSRLKCQTCFITSTTYNPFMYLSLPIPVVNRHFTLLDCLHEFTKEEVLDGDDAWHCPNCKAPRRATKRLTITRLPPILIIHLKRFTNQGRWRDKLNTPIRFPLTDLNLTEYVPPPLPPEEMDKHDVQPTAETTSPFIYDLYGIANHYGTLHGGHYTAFVKNPYKGVWNSFDDSKATPMDESQVVVSTLSSLPTRWH